MSKALLVGHLTIDGVPFAADYGLEITMREEPRPATRQELLGIFEPCWRMGRIMRTEVWLTQRAAPGSPEYHRVRELAPDERAVYDDGTARLDILNGEGIYRVQS